MDIKTFLEVAKHLPATKSILLRGDTGIGKSDIVRYLKQVWGLNRVIDKRISQMSEGDMIGLPELVNGTTRFAHPDWYAQACEEPVLLFLDEYNRGLVEVMQAGFQITLDREMNGKKLHPQTRVVSAINIGTKFTVNDMDPALLNRFWVCDLEPTVEDWVAWARSTEEWRTPVKKPFNEHVVNFVLAHQNMLDPSNKKSASDIEPTRRNWHHFHDVMQAAGLLDKELPKPAAGASEDAQLIFSIGSGFLGPDVANSFVTYLRNLDRQVSAEDILNTYGKVREKVKTLAQDKWSLLIDRLVEHGHKNVWTEKQAKNIGGFVSDLLGASGELVIAFWTQLAKEPNAESQANIKIIHPHIVGSVMAVFGKKPADAEAK